MRGLCVLHRLHAGRFRAHHAFLARLYLDQYDHLTTMIDQLTGRRRHAPQREKYRPTMSIRY